MNGVDTGGTIELADLEVVGNAASIADAVHYAPSRPWRFHKLLTNLAIDFPQFTFVDLGAGKGRALLLASHFPFKRIIGIEFVVDLAAIARKNAETYLQEGNGKTQIDVICADVSKYELPLDNLVIYLFNPFNGATFKRFLAGLERSLRECPRTIYLIYSSPMNEQELAQCRSFRKIAGRQDEFAIYRTLEGSSTNCLDRNRIGYFL